MLRCVNVVWGIAFDRDHSITGAKCCGYRLLWLPSFWNGLQIQEVLLDTIYAVHHHKCEVGLRLHSQLLGCCVSFLSFCCSSQPLKSFSLRIVGVRNLGSYLDGAIICQDGLLVTSKAIKCFTFTGAAPLCACRNQPSACSLLISS